MEREQRRLAAILAADVVGYSRLMGRDESGTLARLKEHRRERLEPALTRNGGRLVKLTGDGALAEFGSAVDAVRAAIEFQQAVADANQAGPEGDRIVFRIGLHLGDLIVDGDDLYGDGVNVAARLEAEAPSGGIILSGDIRNAVLGKLRATLRDLGALPLKNIERPVQAFVAEWNPKDWQASDEKPLSAAAPAAAPEASVLALPDKPSIAVLPFQNMSGDPEQEYFADGIVEDIITALSRFPSLFVIARNSSFTYKGKSPDIRQVGRELGVRYVLEGSVRKSGGRIRITGQLIDSHAGGHLWADRFDASLEDVFELQDRVTSNVVATIAPKIDRVEIERAKRKPVENLDAYDLHLRAMARMYEYTKDGWQEALRQFYQIIKIAPEFVLPHAMAARCYAFLHGQAWSGDVNHAKTEVTRLATHVATAGHDDAVALSAVGFALVRVCEDDEIGAGLVDQALSLNRNLAAAWAYRGAISTFIGQHKAGLEQLSYGMRLNPLDPEIYWSENIMGYAHACLGGYDEAVKWATRALVHHPSYMPSVWLQAAANALMGKLEQAQAIMPRIRAGTPEMRASNLAAYIPGRREEDVQRIREGLRLAGLPE